VETFVAYAKWRAVEPVTEPALEEVSGSFRPDDESVCLWIDERDASVLVVSVDVSAETIETALSTARSYMQGGSIPAAVAAARER
jgi:hypothetical protein